jgi:endo-1,3(4)-beta-glucanase
VYDGVWGGVVSSGTYLTNNSGLDFGNTYYNDHHFHYGYFVYAAAVIAYLDPTWLVNGTNKAWIDSLVRDYANPIEGDPYFPFSRNFDWYHGHSWAAGLFASADGKNQESSSEDTMASYALKMWGRISGDSAMEARGNLMLAVQRRSLADYYLYTSDNTVEPAEFIGNKAGGILFENKIDHTTYFGANVEYIEGIHMIPLMPFSTYTRQAEFVREEWDTYFEDSISTIPGGWRGILEANYAIIDPQASYDFFSNATGEIQQSCLDGGASLTWYLAYSAALGGSPADA